MAGRHVCAARERVDVEWLRVFAIDAIPDATKPREILESLAVHRPNLCPFTPCSGFGQLAVTSRRQTLPVRIVVTNDDGIDGPGLHALARVLKTCGHDVVIVAPAQDCSGFGAALGPLHVTGQVAFEAREVEALLGIDAYAVDGPPGLCAFSVVLGGFGAKPDLVVSGINAGANMGRAVLFSGTVGAALAANQFGVPAMAVSLGSRPDSEEHYWDTAAACAASLVHQAHDLGTTGVLNINVPNSRPYAIKGLKATRLAVGGVVQARMDEVAPGTLEVNYGSGGAANLVEGTDVEALLSGWVSVSLIEPIRDVAGDGIDTLVAQLTNQELAG